MKILLIEDDSAIVELVLLTLRVGWPGVELLTTRLGKEGIELVESESPDLVILDLGLPDISGFDVLKGIRLFSPVPVIILTVRGEEANVVRGLEWGADEYIVKPFRHMEFLARAKAVIKRQRLSGKEAPIICEPFRFDYSMRKLFYKGKQIGLTTTESTILYHLAKSNGQVATYSSLAMVVWDDDYPGAIDALRVYIRHLREKLEKDPGHPELILTKTGIGYYLAKPG